MAIQKPATLRSVHPARVDRETLERSLARLEADTTLPPREGFFGPRSTAWRVLRERALVTYAPRAVMLQYAHPAFAEASASYGAHGSSPGARFERAIATLLKMVFGDRTLALREARRLFLLHDRVLPPTSAHHGNDRASLAWILVTLLDASIRGYERQVGRVPDTIFDDVVRFARLFGLEPEDVPRSRRELDRAIERAIAETLVVGPETRAMWAFLGRGTRVWTAAILPGALRAQLAPQMREGQARAIEIAGSALRATWLPRSRRFVDAYVEAMTRVRA